MAKNTIKRRKIQLLTVYHGEMLNIMAPKPSSRTVVLSRLHSLRDVKY